MSYTKLDLLVDVSTGSLIRDFDSTVAAARPILKAADKLLLRVFLLEPLRNTDRPWKNTSLAGSTINAAVGVPGADFTDGELGISYGSSSGTIASFKPTAAEVETALNALSDISSAGSVDVVGPTGGPYKVVFRSNGSRTAIGLDLDKLYPDGTGFVHEQRAGDGSTKEIQLLSIEAPALATASSFAAISTATPTVSTLVAGSGTQNEIQKLDFSDLMTYEGGYAIAGITTALSARTDLIAWDATASEIKTAIVNSHASITTSDVNVTGSYPIFFIEFTGTYANANQAEVTLDSSALIQLSGVEAAIDLNTFNILTLLNDNSTANAKLEVEIVDASSRKITALQTDCTVVNDLIPNTPTTVGPITVAGFTEPSWTDISGTVSDLAPGNYRGTASFAGYLPTSNSRGDRYRYIHDFSDGTYSYIYAPTGDIWQDGTSAGSSGGYIYTNTHGSMIEFTQAVDGEWWVTSQRGSWTLS